MIRRRRLAEAEASPPLLVEPVSEDPACMARLDLEILLVGRSNGFCGYASNAVAVDKDRHGAPPSCPLLHPARWGRAVTRFEGPSGVELMASAPTVQIVKNGTLLARS